MATICYNKRGNVVPFLVVTKTTDSSIFHVLVASQSAKKSEFAVSIKSVANLADKGILPISDDIRILRDGEALHLQKLAPVVSTQQGKTEKAWTRLSWPAVVDRGQLAVACKQALSESAVVKLTAAPVAVDFDSLIASILDEPLAPKGKGKGKSISL